MTHAYIPSWSGFYEEGLGPFLPLTDEQRTQPISGVLPSGEAGAFDISQSHAVRAETKRYIASGIRSGSGIIIVSGISTYIGSGINFPYPYPDTITEREYAYTSDDYSTGKFSDEWWDTSGIIKTYPSNDGILCDEGRQSGILHYNGASGAFSNAQKVQSKQIEDFTIFNPYIHHERVNDNIISIPYVSTYKLSIDWNPYG